MKILLTGASGFLGGHVLRACVGAGYQVRALLRPTSRVDEIRDLLDHPAVEGVRGDLTDPPSLERAAAGCDAAIHTAGLISLRPEDADLMRRVQVDGTRNVVAACASAGVKRLVHASTSLLAGISERRGRPFGEHDQISPDAVQIPYVRTKAEAERVVRAAAGIDVVILSPGCLFGPGDHYVSSTDIILRALREEIPMYLEGGFSFADVRDVAGAFVAALDRGTPGRRYLIGGHDHSIDEVLGLVSSLTGVKRPKHKLPRGLAMLGGAVAEAISRTDTVTRDAVRMATLFSFVTDEPARRDLGYAPRPFERTVADTVEWLRAAGYVRMPAAELRRIRRT